MLPLYGLSAVLMIAYAAVFTLLAEMRSAFGFDETAVGALAAAAFVAGFIAQFGLSRFADLGYGGMMLRLGLACALLGAIWMCFAESLPAWLAARTILGFGAGCVRPSLRRLVFVEDPENAGAGLGKLAAWEMAGFLIGPVMSSALFEAFGMRAPFIAVVVLLVLCAPFVARVAVPGTDAPLPKAMRSLLRRPAMQSCLALGVAFYLAIGVFDAIWAVYMADLGASQMFIGVTMSLFTLPMMLIAPLAGAWAARRHVLNLITLTLICATLAMFSYGYIDSLWWLLAPLLLHACVDAVSMPGMQLAVGYASGENALAAGQGLFGATGLVVAALASLGSGVTYQHLGATGLWSSVAVVMLLCISVGYLRGRRVDWQQLRAGTR